MTTIAILQSNYIPWKGYFDIIASVDAFVVYDCVQYTRRDWRNRNKVKTPNGTQWLTVPVLTKGAYEQRIDETKVADPDILRKHWTTIRQNYAKAPAFAEMAEVVEPLFDRTAPEMLTDLNVSMLQSVCSILGIRTPFVSCDEFDLGEDRNLRLVEICEQYGADTYLSGPAAQSYLDETLFKDRGIAVRWMDYTGYPTYDQPHPPFDHHVSIVDLLLSAGRAAPDLMLHVR